MRIAIKHTASVLAIYLFALSAHTWAALPDYQPELLQISPNASYRLRDGAIQLVASDDLSALLADLSELFIHHHPGLRLHLLLRPNASAMGGLTAGVSALALMTRSAWPMEKRPFRQAYGYEATNFCVARVGHLTPGQMNPPGIYVNTRNPLPGLTLQQAGRIFTAGAIPADISHWRQLGIGGRWEERLIHVYGSRDDGTALTSIRHQFWHGLPFSHRYEPMADSTAAIRAVAEDPYGIALMGSYGLDALPATVRMVPLAPHQGDAFADASYASVMAGNYPLSPCLNTYINQVPGAEAEAFSREFLRMLLSREGQSIIRKYSRSKLGLVPLDDASALRELARLR